MNRNRSKESGADGQELRERLQALRSALLEVHKSLVDSERVESRKSMGNPIT